MLSLLLGFSILIDNAFCYHYCLVWPTSPKGQREPARAQIQRAALLLGFVIETIPVLLVFLCILMYYYVFLFASCDAVYRSPSPWRHIRTIAVPIKPPLLQDEHSLKENCRWQNSRVVPWEYRSALCWCLIADIGLTAIGLKKLSDLGPTIDSMSSRYLVSGMCLRSHHWPKRLMVCDLRNVH